MKSRVRIVAKPVLAGLVGLSVLLGSCASQPRKTDVESPPGGPSPATAPAQPGVYGPAVPQAPDAPRVPAPGTFPGAAPGQIPQGPQEEQRYFVHTVKYSGESVSIIAGWYIGDIMKWEALAAANPNINPNRIVQGNKIRIPEKMMIRKDPMPKEFVDSFYQQKGTVQKGTGKPKGQPPPPPPTETTEEEPALFGPKK